jgi:general stress protein YciG
MNWKAMADKAKQTFQQRGGSEAAKQDAEDLRDIARGQGSITDKAKEAAAAIREPGAHHPDSPSTRSQGGNEVQRPN